MEGSTTMAIADILTNAGSIITNGLSWVGSTVTTITSNPLLLLFIVLPLVGLGIGLFRRIINSN